MNDASDTGTIKRTIPEMFARLFWMLFGPMLLIPITFKLVEYGNGWLTKFDIAFMCVLLLLVLTRLFEFYKGHPLTAEGQPASPGHLRRYALGVIAIGLPIWIAANVLGNYVLTRA